jgi:hypothetical protein
MFITAKPEKDMACPQTFFSAEVALACAGLKRLLPLMVKLTGEFARRK